MKRIRIINETVNRNKIIRPRSTHVVSMYLSAVQIASFMLLLDHAIEDT